MTQAASLPPETGTCPCGARYKLHPSLEFATYYKARQIRNSDTISDGETITWTCPFSNHEAPTPNTQD